MRTLLLLTTLLLGTVGFTHSSLVSSRPAADSTVRERPATVTLTFSEAVEPRFSTFVVVPLGEAEADPEALLERVLSAPDNTQVAAQVVTKEASEMILLSLPADLTPGRYAVVWRALSVDSHTIEGFLTFSHTAD